MSWSHEFVELNKNVHNRVAFDCSEEQLNNFIKTEAAKHMNVGISKTMLLPTITPLPNGKYSICSFYTIAPGSIQKESLPTHLSKKLPHYPVPVFLIAQLAVDSAYQGKGLGKITLIKALEYLCNINAKMRAYAIIVDCLNLKAEQFYAQYGFEELCISNNKKRLFISIKTVEQLFS